MAVAHWEALRSVAVHSIGSSDADSHLKSLTIAAACGPAVLGASQELQEQLQGLLRLYGQVRIGRGRCAVMWCDACCCRCRTATASAQQQLRMQRVPPLPLSSPMPAEPLYRVEAGGFI